MLQSVICVATPAAATPMAPQHKSKQHQAKQRNSSSVVICVQALWHQRKLANQALPCVSASNLNLCCIQIRDFEACKARPSSRPLDASALAVLPDEKNETTHPAAMPLGVLGWHLSRHRHIRVHHRHFRVHTEANVVTAQRRKHTWLETSLHIVSTDVAAAAISTKASTRLR